MTTTDQVLAALEARAIAVGVPEERIDERIAEELGVSVACVTAHFALALAVRRYLASGPSALALGLSDAADPRTADRVDELLSAIENRVRSAGGGDEDVDDRVADQLGVSVSAYVAYCGIRWVLEHRQHTEMPQRAAAGA